MQSSLTCSRCNGPRDAKALYCAFCGEIFSRPGGAESRSPTSPQHLREETARAPAADLYNPYRLPKASLEHLAAKPWAAASADLAARSARLAAQLLDGLYFSLAAAPVIVATLTSDAFLEGRSTELDLDKQGHVLVVGILILLLTVLNLFFLARDGQTLGKKSLGIRIVRNKGESCGLLRILFLRMLPIQAIALIPVLGTMISLLNALLIFGRERRCLHDRFADTKVVKVRR